MALKETGVTQVFKPFYFKFQGLEHVWDILKIWPNPNVWPDREGRLCVINVVVTQRGGQKRSIWLQKQTSATHSEPGE